MSAVCQAPIDYLYHSFPFVIIVKQTRWCSYRLHIHIHALIQHYGYFGVFFVLLLEMVGVPFPAETTLIVSGVEWAQGTFSLLPLLVMAVLGNAFGSTVAYWLGRFLGRTILVRFGRYVGMTESRLNVAEQQFSRWRGWLVVVGKFIAGVRVLVPYLAGIDAMPFWQFSALNLLSALMWTVTFIVFGRYVGVAWNHYHVVLLHRGLPILILFVLVGIAAVVYRRRREHRRDAH
jgi:membrane protein DedA with SNARE-associated domain